MSDRTPFQTAISGGVAGTSRLPLLFFRCIILLSSHNTNTDIKKGVLSESITYSISTAKARLQVQRVAKGETAAYRSTFQTLSSKPFRFSDAFSVISHKEANR
jgi:hypothetical protein